MSTPASATVLQFTDTSSTLQTLQCDLDDVDYGGASAVTKKETFCAVTKSKGNPDIAISVTGIYTGDADGAWDVFYDLWRDTTPRLYKYGPAGSANGAMLLSGLSYLTDFHIKATAGADVTVTAKFEVDGNDYRSTWS